MSSTSGCFRIQIRSFHDDLRMFLNMTVYTPVTFMLSTWGCGGSGIPNPFCSQLPGENGVFCCCPQCSTWFLSCHFLGIIFFAQIWSAAGSLNACFPDPTDLAPFSLHSRLPSSYLLHQLSAPRDKICCCFEIIGKTGAIKAYV